MIFLVLCVYFIPTIIGFCREHKSAAGIMVVNIFTGWTFFGWVAALAWCLT